jgi:hypothetical protein
VPVEKSPSQRQQIAAILAGVAVLLGGGAGGGYALRGSEAKASGAEPPSSERLAAVEQWKAAEIALRGELRERDREERAALTRAIQESNATNGAVRDAVIALTERVGALASMQAAFDARLRAMESGGVRPAGLKR